MGQEERIAVFDGYISVCAGYVEAVMVVLWSGGPGYYQVFTWDRQGRLQHQEQQC